MSKFVNCNALLLGLFLATLGFSYSLATSDSTPRVVVIGSGLVGADNGLLQFTNVFVNDPNDPVPPNHPTSPPLLNTHPSNHADPILFPNGGDQPIDPDGFDLGEAVYGERVLRYLTAAGGVPPYLYESTSLPLSLASGGIDTNSTLLLDQSGCLEGIIGPQFGSALPPTLLPFINILATVTDSAGTVRTGTFFIWMYDPDALPTDTPPPPVFDLSDTVYNGGSVGLSYLTKIEALSKDETVTGSPVLSDRDKPNGGLLTILTNDGNHPLSSFFVGAPTSPVPNFAVRVTKNGITTAFPTLEDVGLSLTLNGTLYGRPIFSGTYQIDILAFDGRVFPPPTPQRVERTIEIEISANDKYALNSTFNVGQVNSALIIKNCTIRTEDVVTDNNHSLRLTAVFNPNGEFAKNLRRQQRFTLRFGQMEYSFDMKNEPIGGLFSGGPNDGARVGASINPILGRLTVKVQAGRFTWPFGGLFVPPNNPKRIAVGIGIGHMWQTSEILNFANRRSGLRSILTYRYGNTPGAPGTSGKLGTVNRSLGGNFMVSIARGKNDNDVTGRPGSRWFVNFFASPRLTIDDLTIAATIGRDGNLALPNGGGTTSGIDAPRAVRVRIGQWAQTWTASDPQVVVRSSPVRTIFKFPTLNTGVQILILDNKRFYGKLVTKPIAGVDGFPRTGIPPGDRGLIDDFLFGIDIFRTSPSAAHPAAFDFHGEDGRVIRGDIRQWWERPPGKGQ